MEQKMTALRWAALQLQEHKTRVFGLISLALAFAVMEWLQPQMLERLVNAAATGAIDYVALALYLVLIAIGAVPVLSWYTRRLISVTGFELEQRVVTQLMVLDAQFYDRNQVVELRERLQKGVGGTYRLLYTLANGELLVQLPLSAFAAWYIAQYDMSALAALIAFMVIFLFGGAAIGKLIAKHEKADTEFDTIITRKKQEVINYVLFLQQKCATEAVRNTLRGDDCIQLERAHLLTKLYTGFNWLSGQALFMAGAVMTLFFLPEVAAGRMSVGTLFALYMYSGMVTSPALAWGDIYAQVKSSWAEAEPLVEFFTEVPVLVDKADAVVLRPLAEAIMFESVSFAYPASSLPALHDVSFTVKKGSMTAIVGGSGGGKSTIAKLLVRQYDPPVGQILYDGVALVDAKQQSLFAQVAYLQQEVPLFTGTVEENVNLFGRHDAPSVREALKQAQATFALSEGGLNRPVEKLSGGEKQRLALAQMLLAGCNVVVLDEATAALDQATERELVRVLDTLRQGQGLTQVVIAHRLSTVEHADSIIVMDGGRVSAVGTHSQLLQTSEVYQNLCTTFVRESK